jgi:hypothetical protein
MRKIFVILLFLSNSVLAESINMTCEGDVYMSDREGGWTKHEFEETSLVIDKDKKQFLLGTLNFPLHYISENTYATAKDLNVNLHKEFASLDRITGNFKSWYGIGNAGKNISSAKLELRCKPSRRMI